MSYFKKFEKINYQDKRVVNIFESIIMKYKTVENNSLYYIHTVKDGERPEHIAYDVYNNAKYHWIILLTNKIVDPYFDWYMSLPELESYCKNKYGSSWQETHHYIYNPPTKTYVYWEDYSKDQNGSTEISDMNTDAAIRFRPNDWIDSYFENSELSELEPAIAQHFSPVSNYSYENDLNNGKQKIKIISPNHIGKIISNFEKMLSDPNLYLTTI